MRPTRLVPALLGLGLALLPGDARAQVRMRFQAVAYADAASGGLNVPEGVACAGPRVVVADTGNGRLVEFELVDDTLVARKELRLVELPYPAKLQFASRGVLYVYDGKLRKVGRVGEGGAFAGYVETAKVPGPFLIRSFALDRQDQVYLLDVSGGRVIVLEASGEVIREIALPRGGGSWSDLSVDSDGTVYLADPVGRRLWSASKGASVITPLGPALAEEADFPTAVLADGEGRLFVTDRTGGGILVAARDGSFRGREGMTGWKSGLLRNPAQVCLAPGPRLAVADTENSRIQVFSILP